MFDLQGLMILRIVVYLVFSAFFVVVTIAGHYLFREHRADSVFQNATLGEAEVQIVDRLGKPDETLPCGPYLWWNGDQFNPPKNDGRCRKWVRYNFILHAFAFGYSVDGKLVSRYEYSSE